jgi:hypothetical protein
MSMHSPTDAEAFYRFLGHAIANGESETPLPALVKKWESERETEETCEEIHAAIADMEAGLGRPAEEVFAELRRKHGITNP